MYANSAELRQPLARVPAETAQLLRLVRVLYSFPFACKASSGSSSDLPCSGSPSLERVLHAVSSTDELVATCPSSSVMARIIPGKTKAKVKASSSSSSHAMDTTGKKKKKSSTTSNSSGGASSSTGVRTAYQQFMSVSEPPPPNALVISRKPVTDASSFSLTHPTRRTCASPCLLSPLHSDVLSISLLPARDGRAEGTAPRLDGPRAPRRNVKALEGELRTSEESPPKVDAAQASAAKSHT
ncbi:hypothetical protein C6P46_003912 [Rhodotorula mucilaginosa]|uniref:Uncharacterized protein n=1 Tax=Rhodotorula mucilaginosa TaxID=5537 RepID=A0A9P6W3K6_RHOMI|nr:hypothetical protein C6P46_003912 [Rhodotorula mucilaginosa]